MEASAIYVLCAALIAFLLPMGCFKEGFKIQVDTSLDWNAVANGCKKPFILLSDGITNNIYGPTRRLINGAIPFKPYFRRRRRMRKIAKRENLAKKERMKKRKNSEQQNSEQKKS